MFGFLKPVSYADNRLGALTYAKSYWRGPVALVSQHDIPLLIGGNRKEPDAQCLAIAYDIVVRYPALIPAIETALYEHYLPGKEAYDAGEFPEMTDIFPTIKSAQEVWPHTRLSYIAVNTNLMLEFAYDTAWDIEHTLGVSFKDWKYYGFNGSTGPH
jgi:hypothetical protein